MNFRAIGTLLLLSASASVSAKDDFPHTVPLDLRTYFSSQYCTEVEDFYSEAHVAGAPFVYGVRGLIEGRVRESDFSFVAFCVSPLGEHLMVADLQGAGWPGGRRFPIHADFAGSLSIAKEVVALEHFHDDQDHPLVAGKQSKLVIRSARDGLELSVICHAGKWARHSSD
jgi:hypothetical protein